MSKELKGIIQPKDNATLWRYMSFEKFASILATESLFFSRADKYDDKFEGYIPEAIMRYYLYFYKRTPFEYEHEVRAIIDISSIPRDDPYEFGKPLKINVKTLIGENSEVIISPHAEKWVTDTLELIVKRYGFQFPVNRSKLLDPPT